MLDRRTLLTAGCAAAAGTALTSGCAPQRRLAAHSSLDDTSPLLHYTEILEVADAIKTRRISPVELTRLILDRIARLEPALHSYFTITEELAFTQARAAEAEIMRGDYRGPLHGVPVAVKDLFCTKGVVTTAGMAIYRKYVPDFDATVITRLATAGAVLLGKLAMTEGASGQHIPSITTPVNPWNPAHTVAGSSSGPGVATAAGLCFGSLGSDTTGSIRYPCAANGLTGLKPTWGRVSRYGAFALAESLDHVGPMTRSARDAAAMLRAVAGHDRNDPTTLTAAVPDYLADLPTRVDGMRIGVDSAYNDAGADPDTIAMVNQARQQLKQLGAQIIDVHLPSTEALITGGLTSCAVEAAIAHENTYPARSNEYSALAGLLDVGRAARGVEVMRAQHARLAFSGALEAMFTDIDLLLTPTQPPANLTIDGINKLWSTPEGIALMWRFTEPFNMSGNPTITLPGGFTAAGLPLTFQLVAPHLGEHNLIRSGHAYQCATDWHKRHPPI